MPEQTERHNTRHLRMSSTRYRGVPTIYDPRRDNGFGLWCLRNGVSVELYHLALRTAEAAADASPDFEASVVSVTHGFEKVDRTINLSNFGPDFLDTRRTPVRGYEAIMASLLVGMFDPTYPYPGLKEYIEKRWLKKLKRSQTTTSKTMTSPSAKHASQVK